MKTFTTLTAVAALLAGISIASAQTSTSQMNKQLTATGNGKFCIEVSKGGGLNCKFASMEACQKEGQAQGLQCSPNPKSSTTGSKQ